LNEDKINQFLESNPGLVGGAAQTIMKRSQVEGDAYRHVQAIMINPDGSYVSREEFVKRLEENENIPDDVKMEILKYSDPINNVGYADELAMMTILKAEETICLCRRLGYNN
jgi:hypothetical protein